MVTIIDGRGRSRELPEKGSCLRRVGLALLVALQLLLITACTKDPAALFEDAKRRSASGDKAGAIVAMKSALQGEPNDGAMRLFLGLLYNETFEPDSAEKELRRAAELGVIDGGRVAVELARALRLQEKYQMLLKDVEVKSAYEQEFRASIHALRGRAFLGIGKPADARSSLAEAVRLSAENADTVLLAAQLNVVDGKTEDALAQVDALVARAPKNLEVLTYRAGILRHLGRTEDALAAYDAVLKVHPLHFGALRGATVLRSWSGRLDEAQKHVDVLSRTYKGHPQVVLDQGVLHLFRQKHDLAKVAAETVLKSHPDLLAAQLLLGLSLQALGNDLQAEQVLGKYVAADPESRVGRYALAAQLLSMDRAARAAEVLGPVLDADVKDAAILTLAGDIQARLGNAAAALELYQRATEIDPQRADPRLGKAFVELRRGRLDAGLESLEGALGLVKRATHSAEVLVMLSLSRGEIDRADRVVADLEKKSPDSPIVHNLKGIVRRAQGKGDEAMAAFEKALKYQPSFFPAAFNAAQSDLVTGNIEAARKRYEKVLSANNNDVPSLLALALIERLAGRGAEEIAYLERAMKANPGEMTSRRRMVSALWLRGEKGRATELAENAYAGAPDNPEAIALAAQVSLFAGNHNRALQLISRLGALPGLTGAASLSIAQFQAAAGRNADAESTLRSILRKDPGFEPAQRGLIGILLSDGRDADALELARQVQRSAPKRPSGFILEGEIRLHKGQYPEALRAFRAAEERAPGSGYVAARVFRAQAALGKGKEGEAFLEAFLGKYPHSIDARVELAYAKYTSKDYAMAATQYQMLLRHHPTNLHGMNGLAWVYSKMNDKRARAMAEAAFVQFPESPQVMDTLGYILLEAGEGKRAHELISLAAAASPLDPEIQYHLALSMVKLGDKAGARDRLDRLLSTQKQFESRQSAEQLRASLRGA